ncbi:Solute carrier family 22 member 14 [Myotis davidii]|uniref:Solute carrier family 22 member 14 n=1 Tax=Myotis davidii TaxID=225400 RepID=L5LT32_MYODS|nr:Solute carrier family 22 member 14 [Myotis davidii]
MNKRTIPLSLLDKLQVPGKNVTNASILDFYNNSQLRKVTLVMGCVWGLSGSLNKNNLLAEAKLFDEVSEEVAKNTLLNAMMEPDPALFSKPVRSRQASTSRQDA